MLFQDPFALSVISLVFGAIVGSFLNVVINRTKLKKHLNGRSHCPHCKHDLAPIDLIPVFSFFLLGGRCRYCDKKISPQYPAVEAFTALVFLLISLSSPFSSITVFFWIICSFFIVIGVYDLKHFLVLDKFVFPALGLAVLYAIYSDLVGGCYSLLDCKTSSGVIGALTISGFFYLQFVLSGGKWIGFGDVKFGLLLGMAVGFPLAIMVLFGAYVFGAIVGAGLIFASKKEMGSKLPFGSFLALAGIFTLLYGQSIFNWYLGLIGL